MRIALISDIHGNRIALAIILADIGRRSVDQIICLGDVATLGPDPGDCIDLVAAHATVVVMGNTDHWLVRDTQGESPNVSDVPLFNDIVAWTRSRLTQRHMCLLEAWPLTARVTVSPDTALLVFHGSPGSFDDVIASTTPEHDLARMLGSNLPSIVAGGHTHVPLMRRLLGGQVLVNPGSVGLPGVGPGNLDLPVNRDVAWAEYAILDSAPEGTTCAFHRVTVSVSQMIRVAIESGMPGVDWWIGKWRG